MILILVTILLICPVTTFPWDPFTFDFQITCNLPTRSYYWFSVQFFEEDSISSGEWITKKFNETFHAGTISRRFHGAMDGDEILSEAYTITAIFEHDCTTEGNLVEAQFAFKTFSCAVHKPCYMNYHVDLANESGYIGIYEV